MAQSLIPNRWHLRRVADSAARSCYICYKPSSSVLITPDNKINAIQATHTGGLTGEDGPRIFTLHKTIFKFCGIFYVMIKRYATCAFETEVELLRKSSVTLQDQFITAAQLRRRQPLPISSGLKTEIKWTTHHTWHRFPWLSWPAEGARCCLTRAGSALTNTIQHGWHLDSSAAGVGQVILHAQPYQTADAALAKRGNDFRFGVGDRTYLDFPP
ncbi:hypothetical protein CIRG_08093 [Coccidioides immitis RMSCC 2394]|uniref:Uncharacterized protein n=1 Tax=Coccidioides immitis RMSCC 2394 TaxID=404692 RepID=A0A0J7BE34_COCIT|nr:hypothetical protein CIRG_08093 [Coccidioides immitis RMSCC 2394]